jgi:hypothetical protein
MFRRRLRTWLVPAGSLKGGGGLDDIVPGFADALRADYLDWIVEMEDDFLGQFVDAECSLRGRGHFSRSRAYKQRGMFAYDVTGWM